MLTSDSVDTLMVEKSKLDEDLQGKLVDATLYRGMIGSLMCLTSSRPYLIYAVCLCARYQAKPTEKHLNAAKRIFRYLKGTINMGLWYSKDTCMSLTSYADADHAGIISSITAQQAKLNLELVPKEKRLEIGKFNRRLIPGKIQREPTFQFGLDALDLTPCYSVFLITADGQDFDALPTDEEIMSFLRELGHTREINSLNDVVPASPQLTNVPVSPEEPTKKSKRVKRPAKKSTKAPTRGVVIRETLEMPLSKKKEKMTLEKRKGIDLLSEVALTEEAQYKEGNDEDDINNDQNLESNGIDQENDSNDDKTQSDNENESDSEHETDENESGSESNKKENKEKIGDDEEEKEEELVKTSSNDSYDEDETNIIDKTEGDEDEELDYTTNQLYNDKTEVPVNSSSHSSDLASKFLNFLDIRHTHAVIISPMDVHVHHDVPSQQTPTLFTVPILVITESLPIFTTVIPQSLPSFTPLP
ncbi:hypothetical protein Tco_1256484 [Tanacetum coccineum]